VSDAPRTDALARMVPEAEVINGKFIFCGTATELVSAEFARKMESLLRRCLPIIQADARMMADLTRFAPLDAESQRVHDTTEYESEKLAKEIKIVINARPKRDFGEFAMRLSVTYGLLFLMIGIGIAFDSSAMQWAGFFVAVILMASIGKRLVGKDTAVSFSEARAIIDRLEVEQSQ